MNVRSHPSRRYTRSPRLEKSAPNHDASSRSAWPDSMTTPGDIRPTCMYHWSAVTSVSVTIRPVPIEPGSPSILITRSANSSGGCGMRTSRSY